jgi:DNA invertase Pin-like site-specific DNA recombinase
MLPAILTSVANLVRDRTLAGLRAARKRGRVEGRPRSPSDDKLQAAKRLLRGGTPPRDVAKIVGVKRADVVSLASCEQERAMSRSGIPIISDASLPSILT